MAEMIDMITAMSPGTIIERLSSVSFVPHATLLPSPAQFWRLPGQWSHLRISTSDRVGIAACDVVAVFASRHRANSSTGAARPLFKSTETARGSTIIDS
jgi:hypothetical protein